MVRVPQGAKVDAKRKTLSRIDTAVAAAYRLPDFITFIHEHPLDLVAVEGGLLADDQQRVEHQTETFPRSSLRP